MDGKCGCLLLMSLLSGRLGVQTIRVQGVLIAARSRTVGHAFKPDKERPVHIKIFSTFTEPEGSLPCSQNPVICSCVGHFNPIHTFPFFLTLRSILISTSDIRPSLPRGLLQVPPPPRPQILYLRLHHHACRMAQYLRKVEDTCDTCESAYQLILFRVDGFLAP